MSAGIMIGLVVILIILTFLPMSRAKVWWVRGLDFPRLQLGGMAFILFLFSLVLLDFSQVSAWFISMATFLCLSYQLWWVLPYTPFYPHEVKHFAGEQQNDRLRIISANVLMSNRNTDKLLDIIRLNSPHIVVLVETDKDWQEKMDVLEQSYPWSMKCPQDNLYGMHLYSQLPLEDSEVQFLIEADIPSFHVLVCLPSGKQVRLHCLHPAPPSPTENNESKERDAELILVGRSVANAELPVIVCGDLNDVAWSATTRLFRKVSGLLDPRVGRGMYNTFHAAYPFLRWPLDYLFHSPDFSLVEIRRLEKFGSDHFPILLELILDEGHRTEHAQKGLLIEPTATVQSEEKNKAEAIKREDIHTPGE